MTYEYKCLWCGCIWPFRERLDAELEHGPECESCGYAALKRIWSAPTIVWPKGQRGH